MTLPTLRSVQISSSVLPWSISGKAVREWFLRLIKSARRISDPERRLDTLADLNTQYRIHIEVKRERDALERQYRALQKKLYGRRNLPESRKRILRRDMARIGKLLEIIKPWNISEFSKKAIFAEELKKLRSA